MRPAPYVSHIPETLQRSESQRGVEIENALSARSATLPAPAPIACPAVLLNPQARYGSCDDELLDLRRSLKDRVAHFEVSGSFGVVP
jgi:hypothetical protein